MNAVVAAGLLYVFQQADWVGKVIVIMLLVGSALTWSVMLTKWQQLRQARRSSEEFLNRFRRERDPLHLFINNHEFPNCPFYNIYRLGAEEISGQFGSARRVEGGYKALGSGGAATLTVVEPEVDTATRPVINLDTLRSVLGRAIDEEVLALEQHVSILSTAVTAGPFLGLLGSAWGVMHVFASMAEQGSVRLGAVAPGISAALLATVVGLVVAVPSLFAYNWLAAQIKQETVRMEGFAEELVAAVERNYVTN